jgi:hypothetical protein
VVRASADRRIKALKRNVFHANGYRTASVDHPKANPLGKRVHKKCVFPGILKFIRLHPHPGPIAIRERRLGFLSGKP